MRKRVVVAFGGNALIRPGQKGTIDEQEENVYQTCKNILPLIQENCQIVITHGNGPQVGNILLQNQAGAKLFDIPEMPLDICGAYSQGFIGYMIEQQLRNILAEANTERDVLTLVSEVLVDKSDPAFNSPTKPVGPFYSKEEMEKLQHGNDSSFAEDPKGRGWRKVVASPVPLKIFNTKAILRLIEDGSIVISVGGGGIPAFYVKEKKLQGIDAVIDKDLASALLANQIEAEEFIILTDVPNVCLNFNKDNEQKLNMLSVAEAKKHLADKQFTEGSMAPKIRAAIDFVEKTGRNARITDAESLNTKDGGTIITP